MIYGLVNAISHAQDEQLKRTEKPAPPIPDNFTPTEKKIASMFLEHVPTNILDSGSAYGYGYQYYREHPPWLEEEAWCGFDIYDSKEPYLEIVPRISLYHYMVKVLEYVEEWDRKFQEWRADREAERKCWGDCLKEFPNPADDDYGERFCREWLGEYTYNNDTALSRDIDYEVSMYTRGYDVAIVSIHNGCDARCGFTEPVLFKANEYFWGHPSMSVGCPNCYTYWDFEDLKNVNVSPEGGVPIEAKLLEEYPFEKGDKGKEGVIVVTDDHKAFCSVCGKSILKAWFDI